MKFRQQPLFVDCSTRPEEGVWLEEEDDLSSAGFSIDWLADGYFGNESHHVDESESEFDKH